MKIKNNLNNNKYGTDQLLNDYFKIVPFESFKTWQNYLFKNIPDHESLDRYKYFEPSTNKLKKLFKLRTNELSESFKDEFPNYLEYIKNEEGVFEEKYNNFLKDIDKFVSLVLNNKEPLSKIVEKTGVKEWNSFNTPYPLGNWNLRVSINTDELISLIKTFDSRYKKYEKRIIIFDKTTDFYSRAFFNKKKNRVEIGIRDNIDDFYKIDELIHEIGHTLSMLDMADAGIDIEKTSKFEKEYAAILFSHKFYPNIFSNSEQKLIRYNNLCGVASTLFEIDIFQNSNQDFDKAYAKAIKRCYPMFKDKLDPFYVFYKRFLIRPLGELVSSIIETDLYLKESL